MGKRDVEIKGRKRTSNYGDCNGSRRKKSGKHSEMNRAPRRSRPVCRPAPESF